MGYRKVTAGVVLVLAFVAACSWLLLRGKNSEEEIPELSTHRGNSPAMQASLQGMLSTDGRCLVVQGSNGVSIDVVWPRGWSVAKQNDEFALLRSDGSRAAVLGDTVDAGGGFVAVAPEVASVCTGASRPFVASGDLDVLRAKR